MAFIERITYGTLEGQAHDVTGFDVTIGEGLPTRDEFHLVVDAIASHPHKTRIVRVVVPSNASDLHVEAFLRRWKQGGYHLVGVHDGQLSYRWEAYLDYLIISLTQREWPVYRCNELIYPLSLGGEPAYPHQPEPKLVLDPGEAHHADVWKWLRDAKGPWHVLARRVSPLQRVVYPKVR